MSKGAASGTEHRPERQTGSGAAAPATLKYFAICPRGLEAALAAELTALGAEALAPTAGGVGFAGDVALGYAANLHSRIASRVLRQVNEGRYRDDDDLYRIAVRTGWEQHFDAQGTLRVDLNATRSPLRSLNFATLRIKDGIVDRLREQLGARPSIDTERPDFRVFAHLNERFATLYIDLSGEPLFKRGWRADADAKGAAPLKENLAAGLLHLAGWRPGLALYDPFCGSGTIVIEAAQQAAGIAPGSRRGFGFERLRDFDAPLWHTVREAAEKSAPPIERAPIHASDIDPYAIAAARVNLVRAGLPADAVLFSVAAAQSAPAPETAGVIVTNPPYGERMRLRAEPRGVGSRDGRDAREARPRDRESGDGGARAVESADADFAALGAHWKRHYPGWLIDVISSNRGLPAALGLSERRKTPVFNGAIECRLFHFEIFARSVRAPDGRTQPA